MDEDSNSASTRSGLEDAIAPNATLSVIPAEFEGPDLNIFSIDEISGDMDGYYDGEGDEGGEAIDLDMEANPDSDIEDIVLSDDDLE